MFKMFKKINKMYNVLFGNYGSDCVAINCSDSTRPLVDSVRTLEYRVEEQGKVIAALMDYLNVHTESPYTGFESTLRTVIKKNK